jgi:ubiquinone/menaquinone biosynthesis C-methylase UbiE
MASSPQQHPSPQLFFETVNSYQRTAALRTAIELGLFTAIGEGARTAAGIGKKIGAAERGVRMLADYLTIMGFLKKRSGQYELTPDSAMFLDKRSPAYLGGTLQFLVGPGIMESWAGLTQAVRKGGTALEEHNMSTENPMWVDFARSMAPMMMPNAHAIAQILRATEAKPMKVLDIAAGHGIFGITLAQANPNAEIYAVDWKPVLAVATENAQKAGVAQRHHLLPGDAFTVEYGKDYDVALITNFLHHFDPPTNEKLLKKIHAALKPGGRAVILEFVPEDDRVSPPIAAGFSMIMLAGTPAGDAYTYKELDQMCRNAGFNTHGSSVHPLDPLPQTVVVATK